MITRQDALTRAALKWAREYHPDLLERDEDGNYISIDYVIEMYQEWLHNGGIAFNDAIANDEENYPD